jgi:dolichol kinase
MSDPVHLLIVKNKAMETLIKAMIVVILVLACVDLLSAVCYMRLGRRVQSLEKTIVDQHWMEKTLKIEYPKK